MRKRSEEKKKKKKLNLHEKKLDHVSARTCQRCKLAERREGKEKLRRALDESGERKPEAAEVVRKEERKDKVG